MLGRDAARQWSALVAATVVISALLSLVSIQSGQGSAIDCANITGPCDIGACPGNTTCAAAPGGVGCACVPSGCCVVGPGNATCIDNLPQTNCTGTFVAGGSCMVECMGVPNGGGCVDPDDCISGNCVDDVCCADASCPAGESCDNPGNAGMCSPDPSAPAPAVSRNGVMLALTLLIAVGGFALLRRRRSRLH